MITDCERGKFRLGAGSRRRTGKTIGVGRWFDTASFSALAIVRTAGPAVRSGRLARRYYGDKASVRQGRREVGYRIRRSLRGRRVASLLRNGQSTAAGSDTARIAVFVRLLQARRLDSAEPCKLNQHEEVRAMEFPPTVWQISVLWHGRRRSAPRALLTDTTVRPAAPRVS